MIQFSGTDAYVTILRKGYGLRTSSGEELVTLTVIYTQIRVISSKLRGFIQDRLTRTMFS